MESLIREFREGGFFMWPILILTVTGIAVIIERLYSILFVYNADGGKLMHQVQRFILENNIEEAVKLCNSRKRSAIYKVFKAALVHAHRPFDEIQDHVEVAILGVVPKLQNRMSYLFTIANAATLFGLLGTISGLIKTFSSLDALEASQKQAALSQGIAIALNTTEFGLLAAIPCMIVYGYLLNRINGLVEDIEHYSAQLLTLMRTGGKFFENFNPNASVSTRQEPLKDSVFGKNNAA